MAPSTERDRVFPGYAPRHGPRPPRCPPHAKAPASATGLAKAKQQSPGRTAGRFYVVDRRRCALPRCTKSMRFIDATGVAAFGGIQKRANLAQSRLLVVRCRRDSRRDRDFRSRPPAVCSVAGSAQALYAAASGFFQDPAPLIVTGSMRQAARAPVMIATASSIECVLGVMTPTRAPGAGWGIGAANP